MWRLQSAAWARMKVQHLCTDEQTHFFWFRNRKLTTHPRQSETSSALFLSTTGSVSTETELSFSHLPLISLAFISLFNSLRMTHISRSEMQVMTIGAIPIWIFTKLHCVFGCKSARYDSLFTVYHITFHYLFTMRRRIPWELKFIFIRKSMKKKKATIAWVVEQSMRSKELVSASQQSNLEANCCCTRRVWGSGRERKKHDRRHNFLDDGFLLFDRKCNSQTHASERTQTPPIGQGSRRRYPFCLDFLDDRIKKSHGYIWPMHTAHTLERTRYKKEKKKVKKNEKKEKKNADRMVVHSTVVSQR